MVGASAAPQDAAARRRLGVQGLNSPAIGCERRDWNLFRLRWYAVKLSAVDYWALGVQQTRDFEIFGGGTEH